MDLFRVLVVDDDEAVRGQASEPGGHRAGVDVVTAATLPEARSLVRGRFFHAAFVDMQLAERAKNKDGGLLLRELVDARPSCRRYLLTQYPDSYRSDFFDLLHPLNPIIHGAVDKRDFRQNLSDVVEGLANGWLKAPVRLENADELFGLLVDKRLDTAGALLTVDEVHFAVACLFGQGLVPGGRIRDREDIDRIRLTPMGGGRSRSIVAFGRPRNADEREGIYCVVKIGVRAETDEEYSRYLRHVRFLMSLNRRVELLDSVLCDTLGAVCYSFAGSSPDGATSLMELIDRRSDRATAAIALLTEAGDEWRRLARDDKDLAGFFQKTYKLDANRVLEDLRDFCEGNAAEFGGKKVRDEVHVDGATLRLPSRQIGAGVLRSPYRACVVHGDLNAENVFVSTDGRVMCIDYRYTGWGPRLLDYVPLQASLRLCQESTLEATSRVASDCGSEREIWRAGWSDDKVLPTGRPFWSMLAVQLIRQMRVQNPDASQREYAACCLLWALRIFRVRDLTFNARLRLLAWISWLSQVFDELG